MRAMESQGVLRAGTPDTEFSCSSTLVVVSRTAGSIPKEGTSISWCLVKTVDLERIDDHPLPLDRLPHRRLVNCSDRTLRHGVCPDAA